MKSEKESLQQLLLRIWKRKHLIENKSTGLALIRTPYTINHLLPQVTQPSKPHTIYMTVTNRLFSDHRIHALLERSIDAAKKLENIYEDEDGLRKEEVSKIGGPNEFKEFYERLKQIKDFHRTRPEDVSKPLSYEFEQMNLAVKQNEDLPNMVEFSDEEGYGRFLDLHEHYQRYVNIKGEFFYENDVIIKTIFRIRSQMRLFGLSESL